MSLSARHSVLYKVVFWVMCLAIFVLALLPNNSSSIAFPEADKLLHLMAFAGLSFIGCLAHPYRIFVLTLFLVFLGGAIEVAKGFTRDRARVPRLLRRRSWHRGRPYDLSPFTTRFLTKITLARLLICFGLLNETYRLPSMDFLQVAAAKNWIYELFVLAFRGKLRH